MEAIKKLKAINCVCSDAGEPVLEGECVEGGCVDAMTMDGCTEDVDESEESCSESNSSSKVDLETVSDGLHISKLLGL